ncbi:MAG: DUF3106 domain-containing protein, partial [Deltaproteobacteria bacterium]|nr:DUF3106 domain-containing protein [Deltaproteobacteria bacterium]
MIRRGYILLLVMITSTFFATHLYAAEGGKYEENLQRWEEMTQEKRAVIKEWYRAWKNLPKDEREWLRKNYRRFKGMPPEKRRL